MKILSKNNYESWKKVRKFKPEQVIQKVVDSGLIGLGGANFPTGKKWQLTVKAEYLIVNFDEGEPGTFKDKFIVENNPELLVEGIDIACYALQCKECYIYLRREYVYLKKILEKVLKKAQSGVDIKIVVGAGSYLCGEETAIMNSIEGRRGETRRKPPYPAQIGLFGRPTCINNVETLARVALVFRDDWNNQLMLFSISGDVENPGVYEAERGIQLNKLMLEAKPIDPKAVFFGAAGGCLPYDESLELSVEKVSGKGAMFGSGTLIIVGMERSVPDLCSNITKFFVEENCGNCTPCREGNYRLLQLFQKKKCTKNELDLIEELAEHIPETSFCALGQCSTTHLKTALKYFRKEFEKKCK